MTNEEQKMSQEKQIEVVTYERERLDFFTELMQLARTRYNLLYHKFKDAPYVSEEHQMLSDMGREVQFFGDVVEMLENGYRKQSEGEWRPVSDPPKKNGRYWVYGVVGGQPLVCVLYFTVRDGFGDDDITHWMPLPEPPQTEGGAE